MLFLLKQVCLLVLLGSATGHTRLECPPPRSGETGAKVGPCDGPDDLSLPAYPLHPGLNTVTWLESISHPGAPGRFALSMDGSDDGFESCLLLDHVPHDERSFPNIADPLSYHRSSITLWIPDVFCERCNLQLITFMTDDIHGVPEGQHCVYSGAKDAGKTADLPICPVVYHSCAPVSINGTVPRNKVAECNTTELYNYSNAQLESGGAPIEGCESYAWCDPAMYYNVTVPVPTQAAYAAPHGTCAAIVDMAVEDFVLGQLPSTPRTESDLVYVEPELTPCSPCELLGPCFLEACLLRSKTTGEWMGEAGQCNDFGAPCEECFPASPCYGWGREMEENGTENDTDSATSSASGPNLFSWYASFIIGMIGATLIVVQ